MRGMRYLWMMNGENRFGSMDVWNPETTRIRRLRRIYGNAHHRRCDGVRTTEPHMCTAAQRRCGCWEWKRLRI